MALSKTQPCTLSLTLVVSLALAGPAPAFDWGGLKNELERQLKSKTGEILGGEDAGSSPAQTQQPPPQPEAQTQAGADKTQVTEIQLELKRMGYYRSTVDGIHGPGTRRAIEAFQRDHGLPVDGIPSGELAQRIADARQTGERAGTTSTPPQPSPTGYPADMDSGTGIPQFDSVAQTLLQIRFNPDQIEDPKILENRIARVFPREWQPLRSNEFEKQRRLPGLKERLLQKARNAPTHYRILGTGRLREYDFSRQGFPSRVSAKASGVVLDKFTEEYFLEIPPNRAEHIKQSARRNRIWTEVVFDVVGIGKAGGAGTPGYDFLLGEMTSWKFFGSRSGKRTPILKDLIGTVELDQRPVDHRYLQYMENANQDIYTPPATADDEHSEGSMQIRF